MISFILWLLMLGSTVRGNYLNDVEPVEVENVPFLTGTASWYDYTLNINGVEKEWSKNHSTYALRIYERYKTYKVCSDITGKCIECYHNDYGPAREDRVIDLSSYAFKELGVSLKRGLTPVTIYLITDER